MSGWPSFNLGKYAGLKSPGLRILFWPFQKGQKIDLREDVFDIPSQTVITLDNAPIAIDFLVYLRVMEHEAEKSVLEVVSYRSAVVGIATTTLRAVIGKIIAGRGAVTARPDQRGAPIRNSTRSPSAGASR